MPIAAVVKSHHTFDNGNVSVLTCSRERFEQLGITQHPRIEIPAWSASSPLVIARVNVVRTALERLNDETTLAKRGDQPRGNGSLADVGRGTRNNDAWLQNSMPACARTFLCFSGCLIRVISVTRSALSMSSSGALRPVRTTWVLAGRRSNPASTCSTDRYALRSATFTSSSTTNLNSGSAR